MSLNNGRCCHERAEAKTLPSSKLNVLKIKGGKDCWRLPGCSLQNLTYRQILGEVHRSGHRPDTVSPDGGRGAGSPRLSLSDYFS